MIIGYLNGIIKHSKIKALKNLILYNSSKSQMQKKNRGNIRFQTPKIRIT
jgi:hypothetical protein